MRGRGGGNDSERQTDRKLRGGVVARRARDRKTYSKLRGRDGTNQGDRRTDRQLLVNHKDKCAGMQYNANIQRSYFISNGFA